MPFDSFGEEYRIEIDTSHDSGGVWGVATWVELGATNKVDREPGVKSAAIPDRSKPNIGYKRSKQRDPKLEIEPTVLPGNAAYDRLVEAAADTTNNGTEILRVKITEGDPAEAGNTFWESDMLVTEEGPASSSFGDVSAKTYTLRHAADSPNTPVKGVTS